MQNQEAPNQNTTNQDRIYSWAITDKQKVTAFADFLGRVFERISSRLAAENENIKQNPYGVVKSRDPSMRSK